MVNADSGSADQGQVNDEVQTELDLKSNIASPTFTGVITTPAIELTTNSHVNYTVAGITASTSQSQGNGALTGAFNEVSVVANLDDTVTLPTAVKGIECEVENDGANTLQIFPASGDDLGNGVDVSTQLEINESVKFFAYDTTTWKVEASTEIYHAEFHDEDNGTEFVVTQTLGLQGYHNAGTVAGDLAGWTFDAGGAGTSFPIASIADDGGGNILVTTTGTHGIAVGNMITQSNLTDTNYEGVFKVLTVPSTTTYTVTATWGSTDTGTMDEPAQLAVNPIAVGVYSVDYSLSGDTATNNEQFDFELYCDSTKITGTKRTNKFGISADINTMGGCGIFAIPLDGRIALVLENQESAGNFTIEDYSVRVIRL